MNFCIKQLNFLYLYNYCKENHLNVSAYESVDINYIEDEDVITILKFSLFKENIVSSLEEIVFSPKIEKYISQPDTVNLSEVGAVLNKKIQIISKFKNDLNSLIKKASSREFIDEFENIMSKKREIKDTLTVLNNIDDKKKNTSNNNENKKRAANFLFS